MEIIYLILSVVVGVFLGKLLKNKVRINKLLLTFSGSYLLGINVLEIFPSLYASGITPKILGLFILLGILIQIILEGITKGAEHGHFHNVQKNVFPISIFIGLFIHAFIEGIPINGENGEHLLWAIMVHKVPIAMILYLFLLKLDLAIWRVYLFMLLFALASPIGYVLGDYLSSYFYYLALALTAGVFLHISTVIIFESSEGHKLKFQKLFMIILGFLIALIFLY